MSKAINVVVTGNAAPLRKALVGASNDLNSFGNKAGAAAKKGALALAAMGTAAAAVTLKWTHMAELAAIADQRIVAISRTMGLFGKDTVGVTKRISDYADALERETGVTAETIKAAQAKLLTFRQLAMTANIAGDAFDRATQAAVDMAAAGFGEATTNAVQLGKALEDPIKGVNSLRRSGITFTDSEKAKLQILVQTNRMHEAQGVILTAIETQVKGTASATALSTQRMKNGFGEVTDAIGTKLIPIMNAFADSLVAIGEKATLEGLGAAFEEFGRQASLSLDKVNQKLGDMFHAADGSVSGFGRLRNMFTRVTNAGIILGNASSRIGGAVGITDGKTIKHIDTLSKYTDAEKAAIAQDKQMAINKGVLNKINQEAIDIIKKETKDKETASAAAAAKEQTRNDKAKAAKEAANKKEKEGFASFKQNLADAKQAIKDYVSGIASAISSNVSLSSSFSQAANSEQEVTDKLNTALQDRKDAYQELHKVQSEGNPIAYADALDKVAAAEDNVKKAQEVKPKDYLSIFKTQIQAAKDFGGYLKTLIAGGQMSPAAIQQILDLGPVAGAVVAKDMISGTSGLTAASLSSDLAAVSAAGTAAGMATPGFQNTLNSTAVNGAGSGNYYITIEAGLGDTTEIAQAVTSVLQTYGEKIGGVPVKVKTPKAAPAKKPKQKKK
jgi:hypothetical protein